MQNSLHQNSFMQVSFILSNQVKYVLAVAASLMLTFVFSGCSATGPFQSHSAFKQAVLPSGYQSVYQNQTGYGGQGAVSPQWQSSNYPPAYAPQHGAAGYRSGNPASGYGVTAQPGYGFGGQAAYPQNNQGLGGGLMSPFVGRTYTSGSC